MRYPDLTVAPTDTDADGIAQSQTPSAAGNLTLNGAAVSGGVATMGAAQKVTITTAADESAKTFTITGTTADGAAQSETMTGPNATTGTTTKYYKTVTSIAVDAATTGAVTAGFTAVAVSATRIIDHKLNEFNLSIAAAITGTITFTVEQSCDDTGKKNDGTFTTPTNWFANSTLTSKSASTFGSQGTPITALRISVASATTGTVTAKILNSGL